MNKQDLSPELQELLERESKKFLLSEYGGFTAGDYTHKEVLELLMDFALSDTAKRIWQWKHETTHHQTILGAVNPCFWLGAVSGSLRII